jgi:hypothetical protein
MQGYITIATGPRKFIDMAVNFAASCKVMDPTRPVCLVHDQDADLPEEARRLFDDLVALPPDPAYPTVMNKIRLFDLSPYDETMFVDADCLMVKRDVGKYWDIASRNYFSITGDKRTTGQWKGHRIEDVLQKQKVDYLVQMNSGVFYFNKSAEAREFFAELNRFYLDRKESMRVNTHNGRRKFSDEFFFGVFMGLRHMSPITRAEDSDDSWMVSTYHAPLHRVDTDKNIAVLYKLTRHLFDIPYFPTRLKRLSPTFMHFIELRPQALYERLCKQFLATALAQSSRLQPAE